MWRETRTDRKRVKSETGLGSSLTGAATPRSEGGFFPEMVEAESNLSGSFSLSQDRPPLGGREAFSISLLALVDIVGTTEKLVIEGTAGENHMDVCLPGF